MLSKKQSPSRRLSDSGSLLDCWADVPTSVMWRRLFVRLCLPRSASKPLQGYETRGCGHENQGMHTTCRRRFDGLPVDEWIRWQGKERSRHEMLVGIAED